MAAATTEQGTRVTSLPVLAQALSPSLTAKSLEGKGNVLQAGLWFLSCHLGSCVREVLVTLKKNELELSEVNKP